MNQTVYQSLVDSVAIEQQKYIENSKTHLFATVGFAVSILLSFVVVTAIICAIRTMNKTE